MIILNTQNEELTAEAINNEAVDKDNNTKIDSDCPPSIEALLVDSVIVACSYQKWNCSNRLIIRRTNYELWSVEFNGTDTSRIEKII